MTEGSTPSGGRCSNSSCSDRSAPLRNGARAAKATRIRTSSHGLSRFLDCCRGRKAEAFAKDLLVNRGLPRGQHWGVELLADVAHGLLAASAAEGGVRYELHQLLFKDVEIAQRRSVPRAR